MNRRGTWLRRRGTGAAAAVLLAVVASPVVAVGMPAAAGLSHDRPGLGLTRSTAPGQALHGYPRSPPAPARRGRRVTEPPTPAALFARLTAVSPTVALAGKPVNLEVTVTNNGAVPIATPVVRIKLGTQGIRSRAGLRQWLAEGRNQNVGTVATKQVRGTLAAGASTLVELTVPGNAIRPNGPFGALPLVTEVSAHRLLSSRPGVLPFFRIKEFQPLTMSFAVPLTPDPDPAVLGPPGQDRERGWTRMLGPESRIARILAGSRDFPVTWAIDPTLLPAELAERVAPESIPPYAGPDAGGMTAAAAAGHRSPERRMRVSEAVAAEVSVITRQRRSPTPGATQTRGDGTALGIGAGGTRGGGARLAGTAAQAPQGGASASPTSPERARPSKSTQTASPIPESSPPAQEGIGAVERQLREDFLDAVTATAGGQHPVWQLPAYDPDLTALLQVGTPVDTLSALLRARSSLSQPLGTAVSGVAWPVGTPLTDEQRGRLASAYGSSPPAAYLTPISALDADPDNIGDAARRSPGGLPLLTYDDELSRLFAEARSELSSTELSQRFVAETAVLLGQAPGRRRSVLVAAPRHFDPDPRALRALLTTVASVPWLSPQSTAVLEAEAAKAPPATPAGGVVGADPHLAGDSPVRSTDLALLTQALRDLAAVQSVLQEPSGRVSTASRASWAVVSTRWRHAPQRHGDFRADLKRRVTALSDGIRVVPSTVNFFADSGQLQVTVVNDLDAEVSGVTLTVDPEGRQGRLRILQQPEPLRIRRTSRTTVRLPVEAIAPGLVSITARLTAPTGGQIGHDAILRVQVRPANGWLVLVIGGLAGVVLLVGVYRAIRLGSPRVGASALEEIDLT